MKGLALVASGEQPNTPSPAREPWTGRRARATRALRLAAAVAVVSALGGSFHVMRWAGMFLL